MKQHTINDHAGPQASHRSVRSRYWILGGKRKVAAVIRTCKEKHCVKQKNYSIIQDPTHLPKLRFEAKVLFQLPMLLQKFNLMNLYYIVYLQPRSHTQLMNFGQ